MENTSEFISAGMTDIARDTQHVEQLIATLSNDSTAQPSYELALALLANISAKTEELRKALIPPAADAGLSNRTIAKRAKLALGTVQIQLEAKE